VTPWSSSPPPGLFPATRPRPALSQAPPPNPIAAEPDGRRVLSRGGVADHEVTPKAPLTGSGCRESSYGGFGGGHPHFHTHAPDLLIRSSMCGHPDPFRSVRDLGCALARCSCSSGFPKGCSPRWLPAWLPVKRWSGRPVRPPGLSAFQVWHISQVGEPGMQFYVSALLLVLRKVVWWLPSNFMHARYSITPRGTRSCDRRMTSSEALDLGTNAQKLETLSEGGGCGACYANGRAWSRTRRRLALLR